MFYFFNFFNKYPYLINCPAEQAPTQKLLFLNKRPMRLIGNLRYFQR